MTLRSKSSLGRLAIGVIVTLVVLVSAFAATASKTATVRTGEAAADDTVTVAQGVDIDTTDPLQTDNTTTINVLRHFYDTLVQAKQNQPKRQVSDLAASWHRVSPTVVRFNLRRGVKFSNGQTFDARSVRYSVDYLLGRLPKIPKPLANYEFPSLKGVRIVSPYTVDIQTSYPDALLMGRLTLLFIIPNGALDKNPKALASEPIGTGPYTMVEWKRNAQVSMEANPEYFLGRPRIQNVIFKVMPDAGARLAALKVGAVDLIVNVPPDNIPELRSAGLAVRSVPSDRVAFVWLNTLKKGPMANRQVRLAMNYAVDVRTIIRTIMQSYGVRVAAGVPPYFYGYNPNVKPIPYNPARAKQLLAQAGYSSGFKLTWVIPNGRYAFSSEVTQAIAQYLGKVGIDVELKFIDYGVWGNTVSKRDMGGYDGFYAAWGEPLFSPVDMYQVIVRSGSPISFFHSPSLDKRIDQVARTLNPSEHNARLTTIQRQLLADPPFIYLYAYVDVYGVSKRLIWQPQSDESLYMFRAALR